MVSMGLAMKESMSFCLFGFGCCLEADMSPSQLGDRDYMVKKVEGLHTATQHALYPDMFST